MMEGENEDKMTIVKMINLQPFSYSCLAVWKFILPQTLGNKTQEGT